MTTLKKFKDANWVPGDPFAYEVVPGGHIYGFTAEEASLKYHEQSDDAWSDDGEPPLVYVGTETFGELTARDRDRERARQQVSMGAPEPIPSHFPPPLTPGALQLDDEAEQPMTDNWSAFRIFGTPMPASYTVGTVASELDVLDEQEEGAPFPMHRERWQHTLKFVFADRYDVLAVVFSDTASCRVHASRHGDEDSPVATIEEMANEVLLNPDTFAQAIEERLVKLETLPGAQG